MGASPVCTQHRKRAIYAFCDSELIGNFDFLSPRWSLFLCCQLSRKERSTRFNLSIQISTKQRETSLFFGWLDEFQILSVYCKCMHHFEIYCWFWNQGWRYFVLRRGLVRLYILLFMGYFCAVWLFGFFFTRKKM